VGFSTRHSSLVTLILNFRTHSITPQYHVVFYDSFWSVHCSSQQAPKIWEELITSPGARFEVKLDDQDDPELPDEWLSEGEALARLSAQREQILKDSLSSNIEDYSPSWLVEAPTQDSPQLQREHQPESSPNIEERDDSHQIHSTNINGDVLPSSPRLDEQVESSEAPVLEGATLETKTRRSSQIW